MEVNFKSLCLQLILTSVLPLGYAEDSLSCDKEGEFFQNTLDCNSYYVCNHGRKVLMRCVAGLVFSSKYETCVWKDGDGDDCVEDSGSSTIEQQCSNGATIIPHPTECQLYYNCSLRYEHSPRVFEQHMDECYYPDLFSTETMQCENFEDVNCGDRKENVDACAYRRNQCPVASCIPCWVGSCRCKEDGIQANEKRLWTPYYTLCYKERAIIPFLSCPPDAYGRTQFFHPLKRMCISWNLISTDGTLPFCSDKVSGYYYDEEHGCREYSVCKGGELEERVSCAEGKVFDTVRRQCWVEEEACGKCGVIALEDCVL